MSGWGAGWLPARGELNATPRQTHGERQTGNWQGKQGRGKQRNTLGRRGRCSSSSSSKQVCASLSAGIKTSRFGSCWSHCVGGHSHIVEFFTALPCSATRCPLNLYSSLGNARSHSWMNSSLSFLSQCVWRAVRTNPETARPADASDVSRSIVLTNRSLQEWHMSAVQRTFHYTRSLIWTFRQHLPPDPCHLVILLCSSRWYWNYILYVRNNT